MKIVHVIAVIFLVTAILFSKNKQIKLNHNRKWIIFAVLTATVILRAVLAVKNIGFPSDISCFYSWANMAYEGGFKSFYTSGAFADYPPGYIYILYVIGFLFHVFKVEYLSGECLLLLKLPAILCDVAAGILIYRIAEKKGLSDKAILIAVLYLFNPAVILNSSVWGQVDAVMTLLLLYMCWFLMEKKMIPAYVVYGIGVLIKPQMLIFTPLILYGIIENVFLDGFDKKNFFRNLIGGLSVILGMVVVCLPFGITNIIKLYTTTMGSYPYVSVNAYNFWAALGKNWAPQEDMLLCFSYKTWGTINIFLIVIIASVLFFKNRKRDSKYFITGAFIMITMFLFSVRMHERYVFPAMALLLLAYCVTPLKGFFYTYLGVTIAQLYNTADVLFIYSREGYAGNEGTVRLISILMVFVGVYFYFKLYHYIILKKEDENRRTVPELMRSEKVMPFVWKDLLIILVLVIFYGSIALYDLGDRNVPHTEYDMQNGEQIELLIPADKHNSTMYWYLGCYDSRQFMLEYTTPYDGHWRTIDNDGIFEMSDVFKWGKITLPADCYYLKLTCLSDQASIMELAFTDASSNVFIPEYAENYSALFDENDLFPTEGISFRNGTYFDEIYHARTGYEFTHGLYTYEITHPPFGKILISLGIMLFGMNPFGWRIAGTVIGILMLPVLYLLARDISRSRWMGTFAAALMAFDFMHFTQTRIATIDVFVTFFIILMYYLMYRYTKLSFYDTPLRKTLIPLGACGVTMGFAIASKWTGVYAAVGLAVIFFASFYQRYSEYRYAKANISKSSNGIKHKDIVAKFPSCAGKTILFCIVVFILVPLLIYTLAYLPFRSADEGLVNRMLKNQEYMLSYHAGLEATHPYSSSWYEWPGMARPILYYYESIGETCHQCISAFGNPLIWWVGIPAFLFMVYLVLEKRDKLAMFLCVGYLAQYLPWCLVPRITFIYHYFPSIPFIILMLMYCAMKLKDRMSERGWYAITAGYVFAAAALFFLFYPVISGQTVNTQYVDMLLKWVKNWVL